jgi:hypothetical protein
LKIGHIAETEDDCSWYRTRREEKRKRREKKREEGIRLSGKRMHDHMHCQE